ncbi:MAG: hypothetical protein SF187_16755 [Deltaproteobacteria bacterium]|nr:hypothetical protein [Deltaproteobacteria bacterium]
MCIVGSPLGFVQAQTNPTGTTTGTGGASGTANPGVPVKADFLMRLLRKKDNGEWSVFSDFEQKYYFNNARCQCGTQIRLELYFSSQGAAKKTLFTQRKDTIKILIGDAACVSNNPTTMSAAACRTIDNINLAAFARSPDRPTFTFPVSWLFGREGNACGAQGQQSIRLAIDTNGDGIPDLNDDAAPTLSVDYDGQPPSPPDRESIKVTPGNEALEVSWQQSQGVADFRGYTVFCSRGEFSVFKESPYDGQFHTPTTECPGKVVSQSLSQGDLGPLRQALTVVTPDDNAGNTDAAAPDDAGTDESNASKGVEYGAPDPFRSLNPAYVCSDLLRTQRSVRITGLQNNIPYLVGVATLDLNGNASPITSVLLQKPIPTRDFFDGYKRAGGDASGGFCSVGGRGRIGVASLLGWAMVALVFRGIARRRRKR